MQVTGAVSWRREGLKYKKNEVYLDIVESINVLMTAKGAFAACPCPPRPAKLVRRRCAAQRRHWQDLDEVPPVGASFAATRGCAPAEAARRRACRSS
jgi:hypothetical protein